MKFMANTSLRDPAPVCASELTSSNHLFHPAGFSHSNLFLYFQKSPPPGPLHMLFSWLRMLFTVILYEAESFSFSSQLESHVSWPPI